MPVELACACERGHGMPHSHWTKTTFRQIGNPQRTVVMYGSDVLEQEGWEIVGVETGIRYWGETIPVATADLAEVLRSGFAQGDAADRLKDRLAEHARTYPVPYTTTVHRAPGQTEGVTRCCHKTPFELPRDDRITSDDRLVTCNTQTDVHHKPGTTKGTEMSDEARNAREAAQKPVVSPAAPAGQNRATAEESSQAETGA